MLGLMSSLADGVGMSISQVQFLLVCFLSVLLDAFGAFFVSLIGEENRFRRSWLWQREREQEQAEARRAEPAPVPAMPVVASRPDPEPAVVAQVSMNRAAGIQAAMINSERGDLTAARRRYRSDHSAAD